MYNAIIHHDEAGGYWAEVPALPGCYTDGDTLEEVRESLPKAIRFHIEGLNAPKGQQR
jgi:predicted RNase H-like HicB family nuclease